MAANLCLVALLWLVVMPVARAQDSLAEKLRQVARLPAMEVRMGTWSSNAFETAGRELSIKINKDALNGTDADGERYLEIAVAHRAADRPQQAKEAYIAAQDIFHRRLAANTNDISALVGLSRILTNSAEGAVLLRRAIQVAPTNAQAWFQLSKGLYFDCFEKLGLTKAETFSHEDLGNAVIRTADIDLVRKLQPIQAEAAHCATQAVRFAPQSAEFYRQRGFCRVFDSLVNLRLSGKPMDRSNVTQTAWSAEFVSDMEKAAELDRDNPEAWQYLFMCKMANSGFHQPEFDWAHFRTNNQPFINRIVGELERLAKDTNPIIAVTALRWLINVEFMQDNYARMVVACRELLRLDPSFEDVRKTLVPALLWSEQYNEAVREAQAQLQVADTARNRLVLAMTHEYAKQWKEAQTHVRKAAEMDPANGPAKLALAVVMLKDGKLAEARELLNDIAPDTEYAAQMAYVQGLYWAMKGSRSLARTHLERAVELDPSDRRIVEVLNVVVGKE